MESLFYFLISAIWEFAPGNIFCSCTFFKIAVNFIYDYFWGLFLGAGCELVYLFCSDLIYDFLMTLANRLTEVDASTILTVLDSKFYYYPCMVNLGVLRFYITFTKFLIMC